MTIWLGSIPIPANAYRYSDPSSGTWIEIVRRGDQLSVTARLFDSEGNQFAIDTPIVPGNQFQREQAGAHVRLTPLPSGEKRDPQKPPTGDADFLLELSSYDQSGERVFEISSSRMRVKEGQPQIMLDDPDDPRFARPSGLIG